MKALIFQNCNENIAMTSALVYKNFQGRNPSNIFFCNFGKSMSSQICYEIKWPLECDSTFSWGNDYAAVIVNLTQIQKQEHEWDHKTLLE